MTATACCRATSSDTRLKIRRMATAPTRLNLVAADFSAPKPHTASLASIRFT